MIETLKKELEANGFCQFSVAEAFPSFEFDNWCSTLKDSWNLEKNTYWKYTHMVRGQPDLPAVIDIADLPARQEFVADYDLTVDQQYWLFDSDSDFLAGELSHNLNAMLHDIFPVNEGDDYHLQRRTVAFTAGDFVSPQLMSDKTCQIIVNLSDLDVSASDGAEVTIGDKVLKPKKGTVLIVLPHLPLGFTKVNDPDPKFLMRVTVNSYTVGSA